MKKEKAFLLMGLLIVTTVGSVVFMRYSNDHHECENITLTYKDKSGNDVVEKQHICKEKFSF